MFVACELCGDIFNGAFALDKELSGYAEFLGKSLHHVVILVALVDIDDNAVLTDFERFAERRHTVRRGHTVARFEEAPLDGVVGNLGDKSASRGGAVQRPVVADHQNAVGGQRQIQFHDVGTHADHRFDGGDRVLGVVAPVATVTGHKHLVRGGGVELRDNPIGMVSRNGCGV